MAAAKKYDRYSTRNHASLVLSGSAYFDELQNLIDSARQELHLQVYIFEPDETGTRIRNALMRAAARKVLVFLLLDALGSASFPSRWVEDFRAAGICFRWFGPVLTGRRFHFGRRMHHKVAVADASLALVGGINIGNRYNEIHGQKAWFDFAVKAEGDIAFQLHDFCVKKWKGFPLPFRKPVFTKFIPGRTRPDARACRMRIRVNDRLRHQNRIVFSYRNAIREAKKEIMIVGAYFVPGRISLKLMEKAARRGVKVSVIFGSRSDVWLAQYGMKYLHRRLVRNQIDVYEYTPSVVHGKALVADGRFVTIGSYDLNQLSTFLNLELNLDIVSQEFAGHVQSYLRQTIAQHCIRITPSLLKQREKPFTMFRQWLAFRMLRLLFMLTQFTADKKAN